MWLVLRCDSHAGHIQTIMLKALDFAEDSLKMIATEARNKEAQGRQADRAAFVADALGEMPSFEGIEEVAISEECLDVLERSLERVADVLALSRQGQKDVAADIHNELREIWKQEARAIS